MEPAPRPTVWLGDSRERVREFPKEVREKIGFALYRAQIGRTPPHTKPLRGFAENVMEIAVEHHRGAFRAVYVATIGDRIFVLHAFQKKSHKGISTAHRDVALIRERLKQAIQLRLKR